MKQAALVVSFDDLAAWLRLPPDHSIIAIVPQGPAEVANRRFAVLVEGPQLPEHHDGAFPMFMNLMRDGYGRTTFAPLFHPNPTGE